MDRDSRDMGVEMLEESTARQPSDDGRLMSDNGRQATRRNVRVMPLNSRRLANAQLRLIAHAMSLPVSGIAGEQMRQMIDGKLMAMEREPGNVQVLITEAESGEALALQDKGGVLWRPHCQKNMIHPQLLKRLKGLLPMQKKSMDNVRTQKDCLRS